MPLSFDVLTPASDLRVAAITPFTSIDFPGKLSAVVFLRGCPWRCVYCHNGWMRTRSRQEGDPTWDDVQRLLEKRKGLLDGVVYSGGEPCMDPALNAAVRLTKDMGYAVGLHTGGAYPRRLKECLPFVDWVGLDVKADPQDEAVYDAIVGIKGACRAFLESFEAIRETGVAFETRTTAHPDYLSEENILRLAHWLAERGVESYALQIFRRAPGMQTDYDPVPDSWPSQAVLDELKGLFKPFTLRRG